MHDFHMPKEYTFGISSTSPQITSISRSFSGHLKALIRELPMPRISTSKNSFARPKASLLGHHNFPKVSPIVFMGHEMSHTILDQPNFMCNLPSHKFNTYVRHTDKLKPFVMHRNTSVEPDHFDVNYTNINNIIS